TLTTSAGRPLRMMRARSSGFRTALPRTSLPPKACAIAVVSKNSLLADGYMPYGQILLQSITKERQQHFRQSLAKRSPIEPNSARSVSMGLEHRAHSLYNASSGNTASRVRQLGLLSTVRTRMFAAGIDFKWTG